MSEREEQSPLAFQKLLRELSREFLRLSQENASLLQENEELQELVGCGLAEAALLKQPKDAAEEASAEHRELGFDHCQKSSFEVKLPSKSDAQSLVVATRLEALPPPPIEPLEPPADLALPTFDEDEAALGIVDTACSREATWLPSQENTEEIVGAEGSYITRSVFRSVCPARIKMLREQFVRLDSDDKGYISAQECWEVVSHYEHRMYGHVKRNRRRVVRTVRMVRAKYSDSSTAGLDGEWGLDFHALVMFMTDDDDAEQKHTRPTPLALPEGDSLAAAGQEGDWGYLRRALAAEAIEHMAIVARKNIALKQDSEFDPQPTGRMKVLLEQIPPVVIFANAMVIGVQVDIPHPLWDVLEQFFLAFYVLEFLLKVRLLGCYRFFRGGDAMWNVFDFICTVVQERGDAMWNVFDFICIVVSLIDLSFTIIQEYILGDSALSSDVIGMLKVLRLARLARIVRSFRYKVFDDLKVMVLGVLSGARVLGWAIVLFFICIFILGVFMREIVGMNEEEFRNVPSSMFSVFRCFTDGCAAYNGTPLHERLRGRYGGVFMIPYILIFLVITFGVFNLIIAVFIDNVVSTTVKRKQQDLGAREQEMKIAIEEMLVSLIRNTTPPGKKLHTSANVLNFGDNKAEVFNRSKASGEAMAQVRQEKLLISRELFNTWLTDPDMLALLEEVDIDTATKSEIFDVCDVDKSGSLTPDELVSGLMRLRGPISKCDVIAIRLKVRYLTQMLEDIHHLLGA